MVGYLYKTVGLVVGLVIKLSLLVSLGILLISAANCANLVWQVLPANYGSLLYKADLLNRAVRLPAINNLQDMFKPGKERTEAISKIMVHHSATETDFTPLAEIKAYQTQKFGGISYHLFISKEGKISSLRPLSESLPHTLGENESSIGICLDGNFNKKSPTNEEYENLIKLLEYLQFLYGNIEIAGHRDYNAQTDCPGTNFDMEFIKTSMYNQHFLKPYAKRLTYILGNIK